jgi:hypothetical protein
MTPPSFFDMRAVATVYHRERQARRPDEPARHHHEYQPAEQAEHRVARKSIAHQAAQVRHV